MHSIRLFILCEYNGVYYYQIPQSTASAFQYILTCEFETDVLYNKVIECGALPYPCACV